MPNELYRKRLIDLIGNCLRMSAVDEQHPGMKGNHREQALLELLNGVLPHSIKCGTGKVVDSNGTESFQSDIVLHAPQLVPPMLYGNTGYFPVDACVGMIEVKSCLNATELKDALRKAERLGALRLGGDAASAMPPIFAILAFSSDLQGDHIEEIKRYTKYDASAFNDPKVPLLCVAQKGLANYIFQPDRNGERAEGHWHTRGATAEHDEVIDFLGVLVNTLPRAVASRGLPMFGPYAIKARELTIFRSDESTTNWPGCGPGHV